MPAFGNKIQLTLVVRRFYCRKLGCPRTIFTERFKEYFVPYSRRTVRLDEKILKISLMGGNPGERLCRTLCIPISSSSLIRLIHKHKLPRPGPIAVLGIDDWANKKKQTYGTALVDFEKHKIVDLLRDREPTSVENWLRNHPEIRVVSRDRYAAYAKGIIAGAPQAQQVVDLWNLLKNLGDALQKILERNQQQLKHARNKEINRFETKRFTTQKLGAAGPQDKKQGRLQIAFIKVKQLLEKGYTIRAIAREAHLSRNTVKKYGILHVLPQKRPNNKVTITLFDDYIVGRIKLQPDVKKVVLYNELLAKGFNRSRSVAYAHLNRYIKGQPKCCPPQLPDIFYMPSRLRLMLFKEEKDLGLK